MSANGAAADVRQPSVKVIAARRERAAAREARRLLRKFTPPPGARPARAPRGYGGVLRRSGPEPPAKVVSIHRFWSVQQSLKAVAAFVRAHQVRGFTSSGAEYGPNVPHYVTWSFVWPTGSHAPSRRLLNVTAVRLPGRTVLRVDAKSVWVYPRSLREKVPSGVREIVLRAPKVRVKVTDPTKVQRIVRWFDALPISPPGVAAMCPLAPAANITLFFPQRRRALAGAGEAAAYLGGYLRLDLLHHRRAPADAADRSLRPAA